MGIRPAQPSELLHEHLRYQGNKYTFVSQHLRFPNGKEGIRDYILHPGAAVAVPVTAEGKFIAIYQYRFAVGSYIYEFPAGTTEVGEDAAETIKRELEEETGYRAQRWQDLGTYYLAPGYSNEVMGVYLAQDLELLAEPPPPDDDEDIEVVELTADDVIRLMCDSPDADAKSIAAFYRAHRWLMNSGS